MPEHMPGAMLDACSKQSTNERTYVTDVRNQDTSRDSCVPDAAAPVDNRVERVVIRRKQFPWTGELAWRVSHSSIPQGRPLHGSVHFDVFEDAIDYANSLHRRSAENLAAGFASIHEPGLAA